MSGRAGVGPARAWPSSEQTRFWFPILAETGLCTSTFTDEPGGTTRMTLLHVGLPESHRDMCAAGWNASLDELDRALASS